MRVLVAGATGAVGRPLVARLVAAGHEVTGTTRTAEGARRLEAAGAAAAVCDILDAPRLDAAVAAARPEVVVHEVTDLGRLDPMRPEYSGTNRVRREGTRNLAAAARAAGARRLVAQSIAFLYAPGAGPATEADPVLAGGPEPFQGAVDALQDLERLTLGTDGLVGLVLRYGWFYGPGTSYAPDGGLAHLVRRRRFPVVGGGAGVFSFVHVDDAAAATVAAVEGTATGVLNVVDDDPAPLHRWLPAYAAALGAKPPLRVPAWLARLAGGGTAVTLTTRLRGASNARARAALGWQPAVPSWEQGFRDMTR